MVTTEKAAAAPRSTPMNPLVATGTAPRALPPNPLIAAKPPAKKAATVTVRIGQK